MNQKVLKTLEYNKIIHQLTGYAASAPGKLLCQNLLPMSDFHEIVQAQTETSDALTRVRMKGSLSLSGIRDVRDSLKRLEIGSALGIPELLSISSLLTVAARAKAYGHHEESEEFPDDSLDQMFRSLEPLRLPTTKSSAASFPKKRSVTMQAPACTRSAAPCTASMTASTPS